MRDQINFIASPQGITQVYKGHDKSEICDKNLSHLPNIKLENYSVRDFSVLKASDDPRSSRFLSWDQFPKNSTKGNIKGKRMLSDFRSNSQTKNMMQTPQYNCHNYVHDVNMNAITANMGRLVPFGLAANFSPSQVFGTTRNASQMIHQSLRMEALKKADKVVYGDFINSVMPKSISPEERYK